MSDARRAKVTVCTLKIVSGPRDGDVFSLEPEDELRIGRIRDNDVVLRAASVGRRHAEVTLAGGRLRVRDLGSSNGTYVNGVRFMGGTVDLGDGDALMIGTIRFEVSAR